MRRGKIFIISFLIISLISVLSINLVFAHEMLHGDVAYLIKDWNSLDNSDLGFLITLFDMELTVDFITDEEIMFTDFSHYKFIFVSNDRFEHVIHLPEHNIVLANKHFADWFGFLDMGNVRTIASNGMLKIKKNGDIVGAYDRATFKLGGVSVPYYFLPKQYKNMNVMSIATTHTGRANELGDVVAYLDEGKKKCFFGIVKSDLWTMESMELFKGCVMFALPPPEMNHDVKIDETYVNSVNGIRIKDEQTDIYLNNTDKLMCNQKYKIDFRTMNVGNFTEDVNFTGMLGNFTWTAKKTGLNPGELTTIGSKTINITNSSFPVGVYNVKIMASIVNDTTPLDNSVMRSVEVVC